MTCDYCQDEGSAMTRDASGNPQRVWCPKCAGGAAPVTYMPRSKAPEHGAGKKNLIWAKAWVADQLKEK